jgi:hypothetical protein
MANRNQDAILDIFSRDVKRRIKPTLISQARDLFIRSKRLLFSEIRGHPISVELTDRTPNSRFISGAGSLFGFMGFPEGAEPVEELIEYLDSKIKFIPALKATGKLDIRLPVFVSFPDQQDFEAEGLFDLPWQSGKSWPLGIETGISGLPYFISTFDFPNSKSGEGAQAKAGAGAGGPLLRIRDTEYEPVPYISEILERFRLRIIGRSVL